MTRSVPVVLYFSLVFASGIGVGALSHRLYSAKSVSAKEAQAHKRSPEDFKRRYLDEMQKRLNLDAAQLQKIDAIMDSTRGRFREVSSKLPEFKAIRQQQNEQIKGVLTDAQKAGFDKFTEERERERARRSPRGPGC